jgi:fimbrial isopeptide formation D2 family protein/LPXTG-motif cell wall-anchored protein
MKTMKKLTCVMVALVLMLALCVTAFAAGTGSITVDNPSNGVTYTAYKIFDVVYNTDKTAYSYTIALNPKSPWYDVVATYDGVTLTPAATGDVSIVTKNDNFSAAKFSNLLRTNITGKSGIDLNAAGGKATASGLDLGYYLVVGANEALANLTTTNPSVTIHDKNDVPFDKVDDKESVEIGEVVNYTINGKVPDTTGFTSYEYTITDTMSEGLTFNDDVKVYVGNVELTGNYTYEKVGNGFKVTIKVMDIQDKVTQPIVVKYTATVNENAIAKISKNDAKLVYSNNPTDSKNHGELTDKETVYSAKIKIVKYHDALEDTNNRLQNAKFVLSKKVMEGEKEGVKYYKYDSINNAVTWVDTRKDADVFVTTVNGEAEVRGLKNGTYYLIETEAPAGYNLLAEPVKVEINGSDANVDSLTVTTNVENHTGSLLPGTGGIGTQIFYIAGAALLLGAVVVLLVKKFKKAEN